MSEANEEIKLEDNLAVVNNDRVRAQQMYYGERHESPLIRSIANLGEEGKAPVHQRLGIRRRLIRTHSRSNNGLNFGMPTNPNRLRLRRMGNGNQNFQLQRTPNGIQTLKRMQSFKRNPNKQNLGQQRLHRIRFAQRMDHMLQGDEVRRKLVRRRPTNITVQVPNTAFRTGAVKIENHSVRGSLNQQIFMEIRMIQSQNTPVHEHIPAEPIFVPGYGNTGVFFDDRFSKYP